MAKVTVSFVCNECGGRSSKWMGRCPDCGAWGGLVEERAIPAGPNDHRTAGLLEQAVPRPLDEIDGESVSRLVTGLDEFDRVLGGGVVPGSLVLIGGDPGIGKSTLLLQVSNALAHRFGPVLYVSGEESAHQIKLRAERLHVGGNGLMVFTETNLERICDEVVSSKPSALVIDLFSGGGNAQSSNRPRGEEPIRSRERTRRF